MIQEIASECMNENIDNFNQKQQKHPNMTLNFDDFVETFLVYTFPQLPKA